MNNVEVGFLFYVKIKQSWFQRKWKPNKSQLRSGCYNSISNLYSRTFEGTTESIGKDKVKGDRYP